MGDIASKLTVWFVRQVETTQTVHLMVTSILGPKLVDKKKFKCFATSYCQCCYSHKACMKTSVYTSLILQILCLAEQIRFSENCEAAIKQGTLQNYCREIEGQLESYTNVDLAEAGQDEDTQVPMSFRLFLFEITCVINHANYTF